jgi:hypothetical protein
MIHLNCHKLLNDFSLEAMGEFIKSCDGKYGVSTSLQDIIQQKNGIQVNEAFIFDFCQK